MTAVRVDPCRLCGTPFEQERRRGRPRELCPSCGSGAARLGRLAAKKRAYREANRAEIAAKQRAYYEANRAVRRDEERQAGLICAECDERLARRTEDGLCGFCRQGIPA